MDRSSIECALLDAVRSGDVSKVAAIIESNPDLNLDFSFSPLQFACKNGHFDMAKKLIDSGADINYTACENGLTPLMLAGLGDYFDIVSYLLHKGADKNILDHKERTACQLFEEYKLFNMVTLISTFVSFHDTTKPYTRCLPGEREPRLSSEKLADLLHQWLSQSTVGPIELIKFLSNNPMIMENSDSCMYVLRKLAKKYSRSDTCEEGLSMKFYYMFRLLQEIDMDYSAELHNQNIVEEFNEGRFNQFAKKKIRHMYENKQLVEDLILICARTYPYATEKSKIMMIYLRNPNFNGNNCKFVMMNTFTGHVTSEHWYMSSLWNPSKPIR